jgi:hypothetical protein
MNRRVDISTPLSDAVEQIMGEMFIPAMIFFMPMRSPWCAGMKPKNFLICPSIVRVLALQRVRRAGREGTPALHTLHITVQRQGQCNSYRRQGRVATFVPVMRSE